MKIKTLVSAILLINSIQVSAESSIKQLKTEAQNTANKNIEFIQSFKSNQKGAVTFSTVGAGNCDYSTVQAAVDSDVDEVRIATNMTYNENVFLSDISIKLRGGFANCADAQADNQSNTMSLITGVPNASQPVIAITGSVQRHSVTLENLELTGGTGKNFLKGGGVSTLDADASIAIINSNIHNNNGSEGGGVGIFGDSNGADTDLLLIDTIIDHNTAINGGGLYCIGQQSSVLVIGESGFSSNVALQDDNVTDTGFGGGVYLSSQCDFSMYSGTKESNSTFDKRGIANNFAGQKGGGMYVDNSTANLNGHKFCYNLGTLTCIGDDINPININNNNAVLLGGGVYANGDLSTVSIYAGLVENNSVTDNMSKGGGVYINFAIFNTARLSKACWDKDRCNSYHANFAQAEGGALWVTGVTNIYSTYFEYNRANKATAIYLKAFIVNGINELLIQSSIFHHNGDNGSNGVSDSNVVFITGSYVTSNIINNTFVDNYAQSIFFLSPSQYIGHTNIKYSIIHDSNPTVNVVDPASGNSYIATFKFECLIVHESSFTNIPNLDYSGEIIIADPQFVDRDNADFHLNASSSPAVDFCQSFGLQHKDIDKENFGWNDPNVPNQNNLTINKFDAGADETYGNDIIFKNSFEL